MFDKEYYDKHLGPIPCRPGQPEWEGHFERIAGRIARELHPRGVIDVGCSFGMLVRHLEAHGVFAVGIDLSTYAIRHAVSDNCRKGDILTFYDRWVYDLAVCVEVFEHIPQKDAEKGIRNLCKLAPDILFSSANDEDEPTHVNPQPLEYWDGMFAKFGYLPDPTYDAGYICAHARRYKCSP